MRITQTFSDFNIGSVFTVLDLIRFKIIMVELTKYFSVLYLISFKKQIIT